MVQAEAQATLSGSRSFWSAWLRDDWPVFVVVAVHFAAALTVDAVWGLPFNPGIIQTLAMVFGILVPWFVLILVIWQAGVLATTGQGARPIAALGRTIAGVLGDWPRMTSGLAMLLTMALFAGTFAYFKSIIPYVVPFAWDEAFAKFDRALHFGTDPWQLIWPMTGAPWLTTALNAAYHFWFFLLYFVVFVACFAKRDRVGRMAFLLAYVLTLLVGGNVLATLLSSAGPVYYQRLGHGADFAPLMESLNRFAEVSPVWALGVQEGLWQGYVANGSISGISAMPSMHVAMATLMALYGFRFARWAGWSLVVFAGIIMVGSVHLGWHYAIDGYAGALLAVALWAAASRFSRWWLGEAPRIGPHHPVVRGWRSGKSARRS